MNDFDEMVKIIRENVKKMVMFPKDELMEQLYDILGALKVLEKHLEHRYEEYIENALSRLKETIKTFEETIFWLEKNRDSIGEDDE